MVVTLLNSISISGVSQLPAGPQSYTFSYQLPFNAPSSLKREQGKIVYSMKAHLVHADPSILVDELVKEFEIVAPFDLNLGSTLIKVSDITFIFKN